MSFLYSICTQHLTYTCQAQTVYTSQGSAGWICSAYSMLQVTPTHRVDVGTPIQNHPGGGCMRVGCIAASVGWVWMWAGSLNSVEGAEWMHTSKQICAGFCFSCSHQALYHKKRTYSNPESNHDCNGEYFRETNTLYLYVLGNISKIIYGEVIKR